MQLFSILSVLHERSGDLFKVAPAARSRAPRRAPLSPGARPDTPLSPERLGRCSLRPSASPCVVEPPTSARSKLNLIPPARSSTSSLPPSLSVLASPRSGAAAVRLSPRRLHAPRGAGDPGNPPGPESGHTSGMDALKSAGRAIIKSPGVPRHTWGTSKHESE